ncbi:uncharacterized protein LOC131618712 [Vicia villosa]|uniref:uncharacterized protein LOC131618712 n=1 Tax=Vicia villosa TaxID=3911 RepID=UPI00273CE560|nr:uncharacterized protein LOC131618712 [Vicia villosa]
MGRGRGRPRRLAVTTPPASVRVFSPSSTHTSETSNKGESRHTPTKEIVEPNPKTPLGTISEETKEDLVADSKVETEAEEKNQPWVDVIKGNRLPFSRKHIEYTPPRVVNGEIEVNLEESDIVSEVQYWENAIVIYVIGSNLSMNAVKTFINNVWNFVSMPNIYYNEEGYFLICFISKEDKEVVLDRGPYTIHRKLMFIHEWTPDFTMKDDMIKIVPIWVTFPQLPLVFWGEKCIGKVASVIGKPLMTDECTDKKLRVSYVRVLIEVDISTELTESINIRGPNGVCFKQSVDYEWKPQFCKKCNKVGHQCKEKKEAIKKVWTVKETTKEGTENAAESEPVPVLQPTEPETAPWTIVRSTIKGKEPMADKPLEVINCQNGFDVLGLEEYGEISAYKVPWS